MTARPGDGDARRMDDNTLRRLAAEARADLDGDALPAREGDGPLLERAGDTIGRYTLVETIGEGGMGTVWAAEQTEPVQRRVALKVIKLGMDTAEVLARFRVEQQSLALMDHPGIASVLDGGSTAFGRPYFVMEFVEGEPITAFCDRRSLPLRARLELFVSVCHALQHAHQKGVIHRDVKPSNVLAYDVDGTPRAKVIDFGIAKVTSEDGERATQLTEARQVLGTLGAMAPEQASGADVDTRADVYGLGVLLYELVAGASPFEDTTRAASGSNALLSDLARDVARPSTRIRSGDPRSERVAGRRGSDARRLRAVLERELDWIAVKALEEDRERRYASVAGLADDVERYLAGVAAAAVMLALLVAGLVGTGVGLAHAVRAGDLAERELERARETKRVLSGLLTGVAPRLARGKDTALLLGILDDTSERLRSGEVLDSAVAADLDMAIGDGFVALGRFDDGLVHLERAVAGATEAHGAAAAETLRARRRRGDVLRLVERFDDAEEELRGVLPELRETLGPADPETLLAARGLGNLLHRTGRLDEAHDLLTGTVAAERAGLSDERRARSTALVALATLEFFGRDEPEVARGLFEEALELTQAHMEPGDPQELRCLEHLSQIDAILGDLDSSVERGELACARYRQIFGPDHRETLLAEGNLGVTLLHLGRLERSAEILRSVLARQEATLGRDDPDTVWTRLQVAIHDAREGDLDAAIEAYAQAIADIEASGRPAFHERLQLGTFHADNGDAARTRAVLEPLIEELEPIVGRDHRLVLEALETLDRVASD